MQRLRSACSCQLLFGDPGLISGHPIGPITLPLSMDKAMGRFPGLAPPGALVYAPTSSAAPLGFNLVRVGTRLVARPTAPTRKQMRTSSTSLALLLP